MTAIAETDAPHPKLAETVSRLAKLNAALTGLLVVLFFVWRTEAVFPNEYRVPDGQMLFYYGCLIVVPGAALLSLLAGGKVIRAPRDRKHRRALAFAMLPLAIPLAWVLWAWGLN